ncbi:MAG: hypothetical protein ACC654_06415 [Acidimicrobiia bacterium]
MERTALTFITLMAIFPVPVMGVNVADATQIETTAVVYGADASQEAAIEWALQRFDDAGISLPSLEIYQHDSPSGCAGHDGLFTPRESIDRVDLCTDNTFILLHELGHAWAENFASQSVRDALLESFGGGEWSGSNAEDRKQGAERAASVLAVGLIDVDLDEAGANLNRELLERFRLLTGVESPRLIGALQDEGSGA